MTDERVGPRRRGRNRLRADRRRRAAGRPVPRGHARGGAGLLHQAVRRAGRSRWSCSSSGSTPASLSPDEAHRVGRRPSATRSTDAHAVGDLAGADGPARRARRPVIAQQREARRAERAEKPTSRQGREGADRRRGREARPRATTGATAPTGCAQLLDEWKALPRIDRAADDALWRRFSTARTTYTRRRKAHFAEQNEKRERRPRSSRSGWSRRPRRWPAPPSGARPPARTAT